MRRLAIALVVFVTVAIGGCNDDTTDVVTAAPDANTTTDRALPSTDGLSPAATEFVTRMTAEHHLEPVCTPDEATVAFAPGTDRGIASAFLSHECAPCFALDLVVYDAMYVRDQLPEADRRVHEELEVASAPADLADAVRQSGTAWIEFDNPVMEHIRANCDEWRADLDDARARATTTTTTAPLGPDEVAYGGPDETNRLVDVGRLRTHPEAGPAPEVLWAFPVPVSAMTIDDGTVYVVDDSAVVHAFDITTGDRRWYAIPDEFADTQSLERISVVDGIVHVYVPFGYVAEVDARTGKVITVGSDDPDAGTPWPEQQRDGAEDDFAGIEGREPRISVNESTSQVEGRTADGHLSWETTGPMSINAVPYALRTGSIVLVGEATGHLLALDWP